MMMCDFGSRSFYANIIPSRQLIPCDIILCKIKCAIGIYQKCAEAQKNPFEQNWSLMYSKYARFNYYHLSKMSINSIRNCRIEGLSFSKSKDADLLQWLNSAGNILDRNIGYHYMATLWKNKRYFYWSIILTYNVSMTPIGYFFITIEICWKHNSVSYKRRVLLPIKNLHTQVLCISVCFMRHFFSDLTDKVTWLFSIFILIVQKILLKKWI